MNTTLNRAGYVDLDAEDLSKKSYALRNHWPNDCYFCRVATLQRVIASPVNFMRDEFLGYGYDASTGTRRIPVILARQSACVSVVVQKCSD